MKKFLRTIFNEVTIYFLLLVTCICLGCAACSEYTPPERTIVQATVIEKEHIESYTDYGYYWDAWKGKFRWKFKTFPDEYIVTVQYNDFVETYDSLSLYESVEIGDTIDMELTTYYNSEGEVQSQRISRAN